MMQKIVENLFELLCVCECVPEFFHSVCYARNMYAGDVESIIDKKRMKNFFLIWFTLFFIRGCSLPHPSLLLMLLFDPSMADCGEPQHWEREEAAENLMRHEVTWYSCG